MKKPYTTSLFIFRRDLRLQDNTALNEAMRLSQKVVPCFIFNPLQIEPHPYQSKPGLQFMLQSIDDLGQHLKAAGGELALFYAPPVEVIRQLFAQQQIEAVFINCDYTPFSLLRDAEIAETCGQLGIDLHVLPDALITTPEQALKRDHSPYKVFTAFYNHAQQFPVPLPQALEHPHFSGKATGFSTEQLPVCFDNTMTVMPGGRQHALDILDELGQFNGYAHDRDFPFADATSRLSAHLKFGTCSVREVYHAIAACLGTEHPLLRQLYWRDFFTHLAHQFPDVFGHAFRPKFEHLAWDNNPDYFKAWCEGRTGFPIVDAGMRELRQTGFMHNRVRLITASFLVKDLHIDWRWGERYFAQYLVDYDPAVNNGNWQWVASTGCDAQPYFRIFNPWTQQQKFDPACGYIYAWIPELKAVPVGIIHRWDKKHLECSYPAPIIDHAIASRVTQQRYKSAAQQTTLSS